MNERIMLVADAEKYAGEYVITDGSNSCDVVAHHVEPEVAYNDAISSGIETPVLIYVPDSSESHFIF